MIGNVMKQVLVNRNSFNVLTTGADGNDAIRFQPNYREHLFFRN